jgi:hypothetical protein
MYNGDIEIRDWGVISQTGRVISQVSGSQAEEYDYIMSHCSPNYEQADTLQ